MPRVAHNVDTKMSWPRLSGISGLPMDHGQKCWSSPDDMPGGRPRKSSEAGTAVGYRRWKPQIESWAIINEAAPGNVVAAAVLRNTSGRAKRWAQSQEPRQYSVIDGAPVAAAATIQEILKDMDRVFKDGGAEYRALQKLRGARQGDRPVFNYNIYLLPEPGP